MSEDRKNNFLRKKKFKKNNEKNNKDLDSKQENRKIKEFKRRKQTYYEDNEWMDDIERY